MEKTTNIQTQSKEKIKIKQKKIKQSNVSMKDNSTGRKIFNLLNYMFMIGVSIVILVPLFMIVATSLSPDEVVVKEGYVLFPKVLSFESYERIFTSPGYMTSLMNSLFVAVTATVVSMTLTVTLGYALSRKNLMWRGLFINFIVVTLVLDAGIIPFYLVVQRLGMINSYSSLIIPLAVSTYNLLLCRNYMASIPTSIMESARLDGCSELKILYKIVLPISLPIIAAITLFYAVFHWNQYFYVVMFINDSSKYTLQVLLRQLVFEGESAVTSVVAYNNLKMAVMILAMLPILILYPFIQRYFITGIMLGSIKE